MYSLFNSYGITKKGASGVSDFDGDNSVIVTMDGIEPNQYDIISKAI